MYYRYKSKLKPLFKVLSGHFYPKLFTPGSLSLEAVNATLWSALEQTLEASIGQDTSEHYASLAMSTKQTLVSLLTQANPPREDDLISWEVLLIALLRGTSSQVRQAYRRHGGAADLLGTAAEKMYTCVRVVLTVAFIPPEPVKDYAEYVCSIESSLARIHVAIRSGRLICPVMEALSVAAEQW